MFPFDTSELRTSQCASGPIEAGALPRAISAYGLHFPELPAAFREAVAIPLSRLRTPFPRAPRDGGVTSRAGRGPVDPWAARGGAGRCWAGGRSRRPVGGRRQLRARSSALARSLVRSRAGGAMSGEDGPGAGSGAAAAAARERRREQLRQWGARAGAEPGPGERRARTVRFERAAEFLAACAGGDLDEARLMLRAADPGPGAELDPAAPPPARAVLDSTNADGISALHQVSAPARARPGDLNRPGSAPPRAPSLPCPKSPLLVLVCAVAAAPVPAIPCWPSFPPTHLELPSSDPETLELTLVFATLRRPLPGPEPLLTASVQSLLVSSLRAALSRP